VYRWIPTVTGPADIRTCGAGSNFISTLYLRQGSCSGGTQIACNDGFCTNVVSASGGAIIRPAVVANQTYYLVVDSAGGEAGSYNLTVSPPGSCQSPLVVPAGGGTFDLSTTGSPNVMSGSCGGSGREIVLRWTPNFSGTARADTCDTSTNFDTVVYVQGGSCGGTEIACENVDPNDPACGNQADLAFAVTAGQTYFIVIDGFSGAQGSVRVTIGPGLI
jgi:hypothetical protein